MTGMIAQRLILLNFKYCNVRLFQLSLRESVHRQDECAAGVSFSY
jgi:hypothetical protein